MQSLTKRLMPVAGSALLAVTLSGCCVLGEAYYCIADSHKGNSSKTPARREVIKISSPSYTVTPISQPPVYEEEKNSPSYAENPLD